MNILITGGAGFIGSRVARLLVNKYPNYKIFNMALFTNSAKLKNYNDIENLKEDTNNPKAIVESIDLATDFIRILQNRRSKEVLMINCNQINFQVNMGSQNTLPIYQKLKIRLKCH